MIRDKMTSTSTVGCQWSIPRRLRRSIITERGNEQWKSLERLTFMLEIVVAFTLAPIAAALVFMALSAVHGAKPRMPSLPSNVRKPERYATYKTPVVGHQPHQPHDNGHYQARR